MNVFEWIIIGLVLTWAVVALAADVFSRISHALTRHDDAEFTVGLDRLRTAIATADIETKPGGPSADLIDCWGIWPDAPIHTGEDDLR